MSKYIDAEKLYKKIDTLMEHYAKSEKEMEDYDDVEISVFYLGKRKMCSEVLDAIDTLQQEQLEVDIEKEYKRFSLSDHHQLQISLGNAGIDIARHFYKLGLKARKEE